MHAAAVSVTREVWMDAREERQTQPDRATEKAVQRSLADPSLDSAAVDRFADALVRLLADWWMRKGEPKSEQKR